MKKILNIISTVIFVVILAFAGVLMVPRVFGIEPMAVLSGSMEPVYHVGSVIYVDKNVAQEDIAVGDVITFKISDATVVTHRVAAINEDGTYTTKGDANNTNDGGTVAYSNVVGVPKFTIPYLGFLATWAASKTGIIILITLILVVLLMTFLPDLLKMDDDPKEGGDSVVK